MELTPELQKMFDEKTKQFSIEFHQMNCCDDNIHDFEKLEKCLSIVKRYINHFQDYYLPEIKNAKGLESMVEDLKMKQQTYIETCMEFNEISSDDDISELSECLKIACGYLQEIESDLVELGFKLS